MKNWINSLSLAVVLIMTSSVYAQEISQELEQKFERNLAKIGLQLQQVESAPELPGYWLAFTSQGIFYISESGEQLISGKTFDISNQPVDLTEESVSRVRRDLLTSVGGMTLNYPAENEQFEITVFTDHTCPYCRNFHQQMEEYNELGISVRYLAFPRSGLNTESATVMQSIWCSDNAESVMTSAMNGNLPTSNTCDVSMAEHVRLARLMGVTGTPAIVTSTGKMFAGFVPPESLIQQLRATP